MPEPRAAVLGLTVNRGGVALRSQMDAGIRGSRPARVAGRGRKSPADTTNELGTAHPVTLSTKSPMMVPTDSTAQANTSQPSAPGPRWCAPERMLGLPPVMAKRQKQRRENQAHDKRTDHDSGAVRDHRQRDVGDQQGSGAEADEGAYGGGDFVGFRHASLQMRTAASSSADRNLRAG